MQSEWKSGQDRRDYNKCPTRESGQRIRLEAHGDEDEAMTFNGWSLDALQKRLKSMSERFCSADPYLNKMNFQFHYMEDGTIQTSVEWAEQIEIKHIFKHRLELEKMSEKAKKAFQGEGRQLEEEIAELVRKLREADAGGEGLDGVRRVFGNRVVKPNWVWDMDMEKEQERRRATQAEKKRKMEEEILEQLRKVCDIYYVLKHEEGNKIKVGSKGKKKIEYYITPIRFTKECTGFNINGEDMRKLIRDIRSGHFKKIPPVFVRNGNACLRVEVDGQVGSSKDKWMVKLIKQRAGKDVDCVRKVDGNEMVFEMISDGKMSADIINPNDEDEGTKYLQQSGAGDLEFGAHAVWIVFGHVKQLNEEIENLVVEDKAEGGK